MAFAEVTDIEGAWRTLSPAEQQWASELLDAAERWILKRRPDLAGDADPDARLVSIAVVKSALIAGEATGYTSHSRGIGPWSSSGTLVNPDGALVFTEWMREQLGISVMAGPSFTFDAGYRFEGMP